MNHTQLLTFIENILGEGKHTSGTNYSFISPFIPNNKRKLEIEVNTNENGDNPWHCWVSNARGKTIYSLLVQINRLDLVEKLNDILISQGSYRYINTIPTGNKPHVNPILTLPDEYLYLGDTVDTKNLIIRHSMLYLRNRGISMDKIRRYKIGVCIDGKYANRIIIPSYDKNCVLNYFVARDIFSNNYKYLNPPCSRDVIIFEMFINWKLPVILVEGVFDSIAIENNSIPLMGKSILPKLKIELIRNNVKEVYVSLDGDAQDAAYNIAEYLANMGIITKIINITQGDPADLGKVEFNKLLAESKIITSGEILKHKLEVIK